MATPKEIAREWMMGYGFEPPEFLDVAEFVDENYDDVFVESGDVYSDVYHAIEADLTAAFAMWSSADRKED